MRISCANDLIACHFGTCHLADHVFVRDAHDEPPFGSVVFSLVLSDQLTTTFVVGLTASSTTERDLITFEKVLAFDYLDVAHDGWCWMADGVRWCLDGGWCLDGRWCLHVGIAELKQSMTQHNSTSAETLVY